MSITSRTLSRTNPHAYTDADAAFRGQAVRTVAYLRVSTAQQDVRSQRLAILEYARQHDFRIDDFIEATASGRLPRSDAGSTSC